MTKCEICNEEQKGNLKSDCIVFCTKCILNGSYRLWKESSYSSKSHENGSKFNPKAFLKEIDDKKKRQLKNDLNPVPDDWGDIIKRIKKRDKHSCRSCGIKIGLTVHHIIPRDEGGSSENRNLITLCSYCHNDIELNRIQEWNKIVDYRKKVCKAV